MDSTPVPWRFKRPPFFLVLIALAAGLGVFNFTKMWMKSAQIPAISADHGKWANKIASTTNVEELRLLAVGSQERSARAEKLADSTVKLLGKVSKSAAIVCAMLLIFAIVLYLEKRWF